MSANKGESKDASSSTTHDHGSIKVESKDAGSSTVQDHGSANRGESKDAGSSTVQDHGSAIKVEPKDAGSSTVQDHGSAIKVESKDTGFSTVQDHVPAIKVEYNDTVSSTVQDYGSAIKVESKDAISSNVQDHGSAIKVESKDAISSNVQDHGSEIKVEPKDAGSSTVQDHGSTIKVEPKDAGSSTDQDHCSAIKVESKDTGSSTVQDHVAAIKVESKDAGCSTDQDRSSATKKRSRPRRRRSNPESVGRRPFTLQDVYKHLNKPRLEVLRWFQDLGLIAREFACGAPNCSYPTALVPSTCVDGYQWVCCSRSKKHSYKRSIRKGTWFEGSRLALEEIILMIYFWIHEFLQSQVRQELNITNSESVVAYYNYCREVAVDVMIRSSQKIGGFGYVVEIIVSKFDRRKPVKGKRSNEQWVYSGVELGNNSGKCFMELVAIHYTTTFIALIKKYVLPGTKIYCESLQVYQEFDPEGLQNLCTEQSVSLTDNLSNISTGNQPVESMWDTLKPTLPPYNRQRDKAMFTGYLGEHLYRKKIKDSPDKFLRLVEDIATLYKPTTTD